MRITLRQSLGVLVLLFVSCVSIPPTGFVSGTSGRLRVDDGGRGRSIPVLFVHGNGANHTQWSAQLEHLRASRRAVAFDLRGMGESDPAANGDYSVAAMTADLDAVVRTLKLRRFALVGHSYGGAVVASYAAAHPEKVAGVVYVDSTGSVTIPDAVAEKVAGAFQSDKDRVVRQWFAPILAPSTDDVKAAVFSSIDKTPVTPFLGAFLGLRSFDMQAALAAYPGPCVAIAAVAIEQPGSFHKQFSRCPVERVENAGHWLMMDRPAEINRLLDNFLGSIR